MVLTDLIPGGRPIRLHATTRDGAIYELLLELVKDGSLAKRHVNVCMKKLIEREGFGSTGIGGGVAFPHARLPFESDVMTTFGISTRGVDWRALDGASVHAVFLMLSGATPDGHSLETLATVSRLIREPNFLHGFLDELDPDMT